MGVRAARREVPRADRRHRLRAARPAAGHHHGGPALEAGRSESRTSTRAPCSARATRRRSRHCRRVFEVCDRKWRGIGDDSRQRAPACARPSAAYDAERFRRRRRLARGVTRSASPARCCRGLRKPHRACPAFGKQPARPSVRWARRWSPPRAPARPTTATEAGVSARNPPECSARSPSGLPGADPEYHDTVQLAHGGGGRLTQQLIEALLLPASRHPRAAASARRGGARRPHRGGWRSPPIPSSCSPLFFPGGDIGSLAVHGTVNDLAMCGATPLCALGAA
jgi:hypothetical protein